MCDELEKTGRSSSMMTPLDYSDPEPNPINDPNVIDSPTASIVPLDYSDPGANPIHDPIHPPPASIEKSESLLTMDQEDGLNI